MDPKIECSECYSTHKQISLSLTLICFLVENSLLKYCIFSLQFLYSKHSSNYTLICSKQQTQICVIYSQEQSDLL